MKTKKTDGNCKVGNMGAKAGRADFRIRFCIRMLPVFFMLGISMSAAMGQSLLPNGDFTQADPANPRKPAHWDLPDGLGVQWTAAPNVPGGSQHAMAIRMDTSISEETMVASYTKAGLAQWVFPHPKGNAIAETYGLSLYSEAVPIEPGKAYKISFDFMSEKGTSGKLWFRAYGDLGGRQKRLYEGVIDCDSKGAWKEFSGIFHPTKHRPTVTEFKVMLFVYYPPGVSWFDHVRVEAVDEASAEGAANPPVGKP